MISLASLKEKINRSPKWKARIHRMIFHNARPRWWIKHILNPLYFHHGKGSTIRQKNILNVSPINIFKLGKESTIEEFCVIDNGVGNVIIGDYTRIGLRNTIIGPASIGNHVILAQNVVVSGLNHIYKEIAYPIHQQGVITKVVIIEDEVWIAANSILTAGIRIGRHSIVAGGSVVTKDVPPYCVVAGNPAKIIKRYNFEKQIWIKEQ